MITIKLPFSSDENSINCIQKLRQQQSNIIRFSFNRAKDELTEKDIRYKLKELEFKNIEELDTWFIQCGIKDGISLFKTRNDEKLIFGGKFNWKQYNLSKISKDEFKAKRLLPLSIQGEAPKKGNRKFSLDIKTNNQIIFKPKMGIKFYLKLPKLKSNYKKKLLKLEELSRLNKLPYSIKLTDKNIFISFDNNCLNEEINNNNNNNNNNKIENRVLAIDSNPSSIGYSVIELNNNSKKVERVIHSETIDISKLTIKDKQNKLSNKLNYELSIISKYLTNKAKHYNCNSIVTEKLDIKSKNHNLGKTFNRLVNNKWKREKLFSSLEKNSDVNNINFYQVFPQYSSIIGNLNYSEYPDPICASIEIGRRGYFVLHKRQKEEFYPVIINKEDLSKRWKQATDWSYNNWKELTLCLKNSKVKYRVQKQDLNKSCSVSRMNSINSLIILENFI